MPANTVTKPPPTVHNGEIQALRGIAILFVLFSHSRALFPWNWDKLAHAAEGFWSGVDLFLCLSGFVIAKGMAKKFLNNSGELFWRQVGAFWVRRLYRITPSAWLWVAIPIAMVFFLEHRVSPGDLSDLTSIVLHVANIHFYEFAHGMGVAGQFVNYWSLSLEEQFYILLPLLFFVFRRKTPLLLIALVAAQIFIPRGPGTTILNVLKTDAILLGVLIALFSETPEYQALDPSLRASKLRFVIPPLLLFCVAAVPRYQVVSFYTGLLAIVCALIVWLCSYNKGYFISSRLISLPLEWIGDRSYAIYLIHGPMIWFTNEIWKRIEPPSTHFSGRFTLRFGVTAFVLIFGLAEINLRFVERPLRRRGKIRANRILQRTTAENPVNTGEIEGRAA